MSETEEKVSYKDYTAVFSALWLVVQQSDGQVVISRDEMEETMPDQIFLDQNLDSDGNLIISIGKDPDE